MTYNKLDYYLTRLRFFDSNQNIILDIGRERKDTNIKEFVVEEDERILGFVSKVGHQELTDLH